MALRIGSGGEGLLADIGGIGTTDGWLSIAYWFRRTSTGGGRVGLSLGTGSAARAFVDWSSGHRAVITTPGGSTGTSTLSGSGTHPPGVWAVGLSAMRPGTNHTPRLALGQSIGAGSASFAGSAVAWRYTTIGRDYTSAATASTLGDLAHVALWSAALSDDEMRALAQGVSPLRIRPQALAHYWPLDLDGRNLVQPAAPAYMLSGGTPTWTDGPAGVEPPPRRRLLTLVAPAAAGGAITGDAALTDATDAATADGTVLVAGSAALTDATDAASSAGTVLVAGSAALTDATDAASSAGTVLVSGAAALTDASDAVSAAATTGTVSTGSASLQDATDAVAAVGSVLVAGAAALQDATDVAASTGAVIVSGAAALTDAADVVSSAGTAIGAIIGSATLVDEDDDTDAAGGALVSALADVFDDEDAVSAYGGDIPVDITGLADILDADDPILIEGFVYTEYEAPVREWPTWKRDIRRAVHDQFSVVALYKPVAAHPGIRVAVRWHGKMTRLGDLVNSGYAEIAEGVDQVVFDTEELALKGLTPARGALVEFPEYGVAYRLDTKEPVSGPVRQPWTVTRT